jgi:hypothetical protein
MTALAKITSKIHGELGVSVKVLTDPTILEELPNGNDGSNADMGVLHYYGTRSPRFALDAVVRVCSAFLAPSHEAALRRAIS